MFFLQILFLGAKKDLAAWCQQNHTFHIKFTLFPHSCGQKFTLFTLNSHFVHTPVPEIHTFHTIFTLFPHYFRTRLPETDTTYNFAKNTKI